MSLKTQDEEAPYRPPPHQIGVWTVLGVAFVIVLALFSVRLKQRPHTSRDYPSRTIGADVAPVLRAEPEMDDEYWPCSDCHEDQETNFTVRKLSEEHEARSQEFQHGTNWCLDCHDANNRDKLHLANGSLVSFDETWKLCTQCHAHKLAGWRAGVHGKRTGHWWGEKEYRSCIECHNPHNIKPAFKPVDPKPRPLMPTEITVKGNAPQEVPHNEHG